MRATDEYNASVEIVRGRSILNDLKRKVSVVQQKKREVSDRKTELMLNIYDAKMKTVRHNQ